MGCECGGSWSLGMNFVLLYILLTSGAILQTAAHVRLFGGQPRGIIQGAVAFSANVWCSAVRSARVDTDGM